MFFFYGYESKPLYLATLSHSWLVDLDSPMVGGVIGVNDPQKKKRFHEIPTSKSPLISRVFLINQLILIIEI